MLLHRVHLHNFRSHKESEINFLSLASPTLVKGFNYDTESSNGSGKSSIFMAVEFALYENTLEYLTWGESEGYVELEFSHNGDTFLVKKEYTKTDYMTTIWKNGTVQSSSKTETKDLIKDLLGISKDMLENTLFHSQKLNVSFGNMSPKLKAGFVMELLDITKWEKFHKISSTMCREVQDAMKRCGVMEELLTAEIVKIKEDLQTAKEDEVKKQLRMHSEVLVAKQEQLKMYEHAEFLLSQKDNTERSLAKAQSNYNITKQSYDAQTAEVTKLETLKSDIDRRKVVAPDMNYKSSILQSSLSIEKQISAVQQEIKVRKEHIQTQKKKSQAIIDAKVCPFCEREIDDSYHQKVHLTLQQQEEELQTYVLGLEQSIGGLTTQKAKLSTEINELTQQATLYELHIAEKRDVYSRIDSANEKTRIYGEQLGKLTDDIKMLTEQLTTLEKQIVGYDKVQAGILRADIETKKFEVRKCETELARIDSLRNNEVTKQVELTTVKGETEEHGRAYAILKHTSAMFSANGIQKWLFVNVLGEINSLANSLLDPLGFKIRFIFEKQKTSAEGFKPAFEILIQMPDSGEFPLYLLSGGESTMVNFALRLAFSTIVATTHDFSFMIIDEGFHHLDDKNRELVANMILQLALQFQVFVITHIPDFESYFTNMLIVQKQNNVSTVVY